MTEMNCSIFHADMSNQDVSVRDNRGHYHLIGKDVYALFVL